MGKDQLEFLFKQYYSGRGTPGEVTAFLEIYASGRYRSEIGDLLCQAIREEQPGPERRPEEIERMKAAIYAGGSARQRQVRLQRLFYAASLLLIVSTVAYLLSGDRKPPLPAIAVSSVQDERKAPVRQVTISAAPGRQRQIVLPDSSRVWLNTLSSISYPETFAANQRSVHITGEVYFEVAGSSKRPFLVNTHDLRVEVLGTRFTVTNYQDEPATRVALLEGRVKVSSNGYSRVLGPGHQLSASSTRGNPFTVSTLPDTKVPAWKTGYFAFDKTGVAEAIRQIARWYQLKPVYPQGIPRKRISGEMGQNMELPQVLEVLRTMGIHCSVKDGMLVVQP